MFKKKTKDHSFYDVSLFIIVIGILVFTYGAVGWLFNAFGNSCRFVLPSEKVMGGAIIMALGYIQLELELMRAK